MSTTPGLREITLGVGSLGWASIGADGTPDTAVDLGPQHPSSHGLLRLRLGLDGDRIVTAEPIVGAMHRGAEKLFEVRDYRQAMALANRHDWLAAFSNELGIALAVESMLGMDVPVRATWARMLLAELNRVLSHLAFLGSFPTLNARPIGVRIASTITASGIGSVSLGCGWWEEGLGGGRCFSLQRP